MTNRPERTGPRPQEAGRTASDWRLALLILEGYAYLLLIVGAFVGALALLAWGVAARQPLVALAAVFVGLPLTVTTAHAIRALFVRVPEPEGVPVEAAAAPRLQAMVEDVRRRLRAPRVHRVLVGDEFNASIVQVPRLAVFFPRNILVLGYPLLITLSPDGLRAVIAHEVAHLSSAHGRRAVWVFRAWQSWVRLMRSLAMREATPAHAHLLFRWFSPRFHAHASAVARSQERLADRIAVEIAGGPAAVEALVAIELGGEFLESTFWPDVFDAVEREPEPPRPFEAMGPALQTALWSQAGRGIDEVLGRSGDPEGTHPPLRDRLQAIGLGAERPAPPETTAGDALLGAYLATVAAALDRRWQDTHRDRWRARHEVVQTRRARLAQLAAVAAPTPEERFERAELVHHLDGEDGALPHYRNALEAGHARAALVTGRILLDREDEAGVALIERAMNADPALVAEGCERLVDFLSDRGRLAEAHAYRLRATRQASRDGMAASERSALSAVDRFASHDLSAAELSAVVERLTHHTQVVQAFMVRKHLRYSGGAQLVLAIETRGAGAPEIAGRIGVDALGRHEATVVILDRRQQSLRDALEAVPGAKIYARS